MKNTYKLRDKEICFENVSVDEATRVQSAMTILSGATNADFELMAQAQEFINNLALKKTILKADNKDQQDINLKKESIASFFGSEMVIMEISTLFLKELASFFQSSKVLSQVKI